MKREYGRTQDVTHNTVGNGWVPFSTMLEYLQQIRHEVAQVGIDPMEVLVSLQMRIWDGRPYTVIAWRAVKEVSDEPDGAVHPEGPEAEETGNDAA